MPVPATIKGQAGYRVRRQSALRLLQGAPEGLSGLDPRFWEKPHVWNPPAEIASRLQVGSSG